MEKRQSGEFKGQKFIIEEQYEESQARMRILEDFQNPEVINAETNLVIVNFSYQENMITNFPLAWVHHTSLKI